MQRNWGWSTKFLLMKLWVLPKYPRIMILEFWMYSTILRIWGMEIPTKVCSDMMLTSCTDGCSINCSIPYGGSSPSSSLFSNMNNFSSRHSCPFDHFLLHPKHDSLAHLSSISLGKILVGWGVVTLFGMYQSLPPHMDPMKYLHIIVFLASTKAKAPWRVVGWHILRACWIMYNELYEWLAMPFRLIGHCLPCWSFCLLHYLGRTSTSQSCSIPPSTMSTQDQA